MSSASPFGTIATLAITPGFACVEGTPRAALRRTVQPIGRVNRFGGETTETIRLVNPLVIFSV
jgi:hypothetical protein